ncbi:MAG: thymidine phosphorylase [Spirochaetales bacterium]|nr:thymidine phosphorylase [Spirochaetales bacterium]
MTVTDLIQKKRDRGTLSRQEIDYLVSGYVGGSIPDYQMSAFLMAVWFNGMDHDETAGLTTAMMNSGDVVDLSALPGIKVDKHSTGGVADTTTLVAAPVVAACGGTVAKMSGRGLGHTGGTLDKLESIPGLSVSWDMAGFTRIVRDCGLSVIGQTANLVPADKMLYALRDVTATVDNISLIASSIMSKKLASGSDAIVLDVKTGSGAFMKGFDQAMALASEMVSIGRHAGKNTMALVTDMSQPLGNAVGNALEVQEAIEILSGFHKGDLLTVSRALAARMLMVSGLAEEEDGAEQKVDEAISSGRALEKLKAMIEAQGGDPRVCDDVTLLPRAKKRLKIEAPADGYVHAMDTAEIGMAALLLGAGRRTKTDTIDPAVGIWMQKRLGDRVETGEILGEFHVNNEAALEESVERFLKAVHIQKGPATVPALIRGRV